MTFPPDDAGTRPSGPRRGRPAIPVIGALLAWAATATAETLVFGPNELVTASTASNAGGAPVVEITDDGVAHALWVMGPMSDEGIYVASAPPGGSYGAATRLNGGTSPSVDYGPFRGPTLRSFGSYVAAGWKNRMSDQPEPIWAARSTDMGTTWEPALRADPGAVGMDEFRDFQAIGLFPDGRLAHVWMLTDRVVGSTRFEWSGQDAGGTFGAPVSATAAAPGQPCECCYPDQLVLDDGSTVLLAFRGNDADLRVIHVTRSTDGGSSFAQDFAVDSSGWMITACPATGPSLAADGDVVLATWISGAGGNRAWLARSADRGASWAPMIQVDDFGGSRGLNYPEVAIRGDLAVVVWEGRRLDGGRGIFASTSIDAGATWGSSVLVSDDMGSAMRLNPTVAIAPDFGVEVVWIDHRLGNPRVFRARGRTASTSGPNVLREILTGSLQGSGPTIASLVSDGLAIYRPLFGATLPFTDPEAMLLPSSGATLVFYGFDDPAVARIGIVKDVAADSIRIVELP